MKALIGGLIGLAVSVSASAELLLEGRVRLESGEPVADAQVKLFDMADLQRGAVVRATTDGTGYFALPFAALTGSALPKSFTLGQNYPNPFNPSTIIPYQLATSSLVRLAVFNLLGQRVVTLVDGERPAGFHTASWDATDAVGHAVGAGIYIYRMTVGMERQSGRMVLIDGQAGVAAAGAASGLSGASDGDGSAGEESEVYGLSVSGSGLAPYMDPEFRVRSGMAPVELVVSAALQPASKAADPDALVEIPDANLRRVLEAHLGKEIDAPITVADMEVLTDLDAKLASIIDLTGLEFAATLTSLNLSLNRIEDVSPLSGLTNLTGLDLSFNSITDVSPLSGLTNLTELNLRGNSITDASPLSGLTNLTELLLQDNAITDVSPLSGLTNLERRDFVLEEEVTGEPVTIPDANLRAAIAAALSRASDALITAAVMEVLIELYARDANIIDLTGLEFAANLTSLNLQGNVIADVSPLSGLTNLTSLNLRGNAIADVSPLSGLTNLTSLDLWDNAIADVSPLANLTNLQGLYLDGNAIADVSPLSSLTNLTRLYLGGNAIADVSPLANLTNLTTLDLWGNAIADVSPLANLTNLQWLLLQVNSITDVSPLANLTNLIGLYLQVNSITDVSPLANLTNLTTLYLQVNSITDVSPLANLTNLTTLLLQGNSITDFSPLAGLTNLERLDFVLEEEVTGEPETIPDANLRAVIAGLLGRASDAPITVADMETLTFLAATERGISDLTGLELATNLTELRLQGNRIVNIAPLSSLTRLDRLDLSNNRLADVSPLSGLTNLTGLELQDNAITDVSPLSGLTNLTGLNLRGNAIADVSPLSGLTNLTGLELQDNAITDVSPLSGLTNLTELYLEGNAITDVSPLVDLTNLTELNLRGNRIADVSPLLGLPNLYLHYDDTLIPDGYLRSAIAAALGKARNAPITVADMETLTYLEAAGLGIGDLTGLELATNLTRLVIYSNAITDVSPLSGLTNLTTLDLWGNAIADVSPLSSLTNLTDLNLQNNSITDVSPLSGLTNLTELLLGGNAIADVSPLSGLTNLTELYLRGNRIADVSPLSGLTNLQWLYLDGNAITDVSLSDLPSLRVLGLQDNRITNVSLSGLTNLESLSLQDNAIMDVSSLSGLTNLQWLYLQDNAIEDVSPLVDLPSLRVLNLRDNPLNVTSINNHITALESRGIEVGFYSSRQSQGDFNIELVFLDRFFRNFTSSQQGEFEQAARRWMSIITEDLPDYEFTQGWSGTCGNESFEIPAGERIDDLRIYVSHLDADDPVGGRGGPILLRETHLPVVGCMRFRPDASSVGLGIHEIAHVLGFEKTVWESFGFLHGLDSDPHFNGPLAVAAFDAAGGVDYAGPEVPVEEDDWFSHWRNAVFGYEIMQAGGGGGLSAITIQALADLGYGVDVTQADPYTLPSAASAKVAAAHAESELLCGVGDGQEREPIYVVDQQGYIIRTIGD